MAEPVRRRVGGVQNIWLDHMTELVRFVDLRGSQHRVAIKRKQANGSYTSVKANFGDLVQPDDVIQVKESIF